MQRVHPAWTTALRARGLVSRAAFALGAAAAVFETPHALAATLAPHVEVDGAELTEAQVRHVGGPWMPTPWAALGEVQLSPGEYEVRIRFQVTGPGDALATPACADRRAVMLDGRTMGRSPAPTVLNVAIGWHELVLVFEVGAYEHRIACGQPPRIGHPVQSRDGLSILRFDSPRAGQGGGAAVVYVPPGHDEGRPSPVLVGAHPWNGSMWTYAAYAELIREARARDVLLLMPSGLGNSLYTADAEDEVLRAIVAFSSAAAVDSRAVSIWGASMGGAGATTIGLHHPDRFATITTFFGDSKYDLLTYVGAILKDERAAHRVNGLDVVDNARHVPVWLVHGEADRTSPVSQSQQLADALARRGFAVRFDRVPGAGHEGALVARFLPRLVALAASARVPDVVTRVTYRSVRPSDLGAYGVRFERADALRDAFIDVELEHDGVHVREAEGVRQLWLAPGALGSDSSHLPPFVVDGRGRVQVAWERQP